jgi:hypothetical protein
MWVFTIFTRLQSFEMLITVYPASWALTAVVMLTAYFFLRRREFAE